MKRRFATSFINIFLLPLSLFGYQLELNTSYDYFRGASNGSYNGNTGALISANFGSHLYDCLGFQAGGSFGLYNWQGHENVVLKNEKTNLQQGFFSLGLTSKTEDFSYGLLYDGQYLNHFSVYDVNVYVDQLRLHAGYSFCLEEIGLWGTMQLNKERKNALGVPVSFRAISQLNLFWTHYFASTSFAMVWVGAPYTRSLMFPGKTAGIIDAGFSLRAPLTDNLFVDAHGMYMVGRSRNGHFASRNYGANICVGLTYLFGDGCSFAEGLLMPVANNSNFLTDISHNQ